MTERTIRMYLNILEDGRLIYLNSSLFIRHPTVDVYSVSSTSASKCFSILRKNPLPRCFHYFYDIDSKSVQLASALFLQENKKHLLDFICSLNIIILHISHFDDGRLDSRRACYR